AERPLSRRRSRDNVLPGTPAGRLRRLLASIGWMHRQVMTDRAERAGLPRMSGELDATRRFWNASPCDGQEDAASRARFRYGKDPWLLPLLGQIAAAHPDVVEIGCGQATDG